MTAAFESDPEVRPLAGVGDGEDLDCTQAAGHDDGGQHLSSSGTVWVDPTLDWRLVPPCELRSEWELAAQEHAADLARDPEPDADQHCVADAWAAANPAAEWATREDCVALLPDAARAAAAKSLQSPRDRRDESLGPALHGREVVTAQLLPEAGKSADEVLAELIADLDATPPDRYPGDDPVQSSSQDQELAMSGDTTSSPLRSVALDSRELPVEHAEDCYGCERPGVVHCTTHSWAEHEALTALQLQQASETDRAERIHRGRRRVSPGSRIHPHRGPGRRP